MRYPFFLLFFIFGCSLFGQKSIQGRVINKETREPLAYAKIQPNQGPQILTNIDGSFKIELSKDPDKLSISYVGFETMQIDITRATQYLQVGMTPSFEELETVTISTGPNPAEEIIRKAIEKRDLNDPEKVLKAYKYTSYTKFIIDNEFNGISLDADSTSTAIQTIINEGRAYLSEKVSEKSYSLKNGRREDVIGIETAGFKKPVYNVLAMEVNPFSLYKEDYKLYKTPYAGPLAKDALKNYNYQILDTIVSERPSYMIYFKPKREKIVAGLEGILYLDTESFAIQKAVAQLLGEIRLEITHHYKFYPEKNLWFPSSQITRIRPGAGGKEISVFGGSISVGAVQKGKGLINSIFGSQEVSKDFYLNSTTVNYNIDLDIEPQVKKTDAEIFVTPEAPIKDPDFWNKNRKIEFSSRDEATKEKVDSLIKAGNVERKIEVKKAMASGSYPLAFWDLDLSKIFKFNNYEGIRLGIGGRTNDRVSDKFNINGYTTYGFKDEVFKYGLGTQIYLNKQNGTKLNFNFSRDIKEVASFDYLKGQNTFSILEPRFVNINFFYNYRRYSTGLEHQFFPKLDTQLRLSKEDIWQIRDYSYLENSEEIQDYDLTTASFSFLWRPFSRFLNTPDGNIILEKAFPQFTGQIEQSFAAFGGDFNFTRIGLKAEHEIKRLDRSRTEFILEGNYAFGDIPLTHVFHSYPNNPGREGIMRRFSVAGRNSFETMYFNEFYSTRQGMLHVRHQLRPFLISKNFQPELVFISRHAIGDFDDQERHQNVSFNTLEHGYSEAGLELNKLLAGFGLSFAYRYGAYHLPGFKENFSFKFTLQLQL